MDVGALPHGLLTNRQIKSSQYNTLSVIVCNFKLHMWYIPSEKIGQNIVPLRNSFFVANYQHWTSTRALEPLLGHLDP